MDSECDSSSSSDDSDFNFGDMRTSDDEDNKTKKNTQQDAINIDCNLTLHEPKWFLKNISNNADSFECHRNNKFLKTQRYRCELLYAQKKYKEALVIIKDVFKTFDVDPNIQYGNELTDILMRCLSKMKQFDDALPFIDQILAHDVSFCSLQLIASLLMETNQSKKALDKAMELTIKESLNPMSWYFLSLCCKNEKKFDFCFICLRSLEFNIGMFKDIKRYKESQKYHCDMLKFAHEQMIIIKPFLTIKNLADCELIDIKQILQNKRQNLLIFLEQAWKRFSFKVAQNN